MLECLLAAGDRVVSAEELLERVWDEAADPFTTAVKTTIAPAAGQARRAARHPDRPRGRIPDRRTVMNLIRKAFTAIRLHWRTLRLQLALLYAGAFVVLGAALLAVSGPARAQRVRQRDRQQYLAQCRSPAATSTSAPRSSSWSR